MYWVPVFGSLYKLILSITQEPTKRVPGLLGLSSSLTLESWRMLPAALSGKKGARLVLLRSLPDCILGLLQRRIGSQIIHLQVLIEFRIHRIYGLVFRIAGALEYRLQ